MYGKRTPVEAPGGRAETCLRVMLQDAGRLRAGWRWMMHGGGRSVQGGGRNGWQGVEICCFMLRKEKNVRRVRVCRLRPGGCAAGALPARARVSGSTGIQSPMVDVLPVRAFRFRVGPRQGVQQGGNACQTPRKPSQPSPGSATARGNPRRRKIRLPFSPLQQRNPAFILPALQYSLGQSKPWVPINRLKGVSAWGPRLMFPAPPEVRLVPLLVCWAERSE